MPRKTKQNLKMVKICNQKLQIWFRHIKTKQTCFQIGHFLRWKKQICEC